jgi:coenzyme F420 hydrogenase subunit beta
MKNISSVVEKGLCTGCGLCKSICPSRAIHFIWDEFGDRVPEVDESLCIECPKCLQVCPGESLDFAQLNQVCQLQQEDQFSQGVGLYKSLSVMFSKDVDVINLATSGGVVREIAAVLIEIDEVNGVIMITENRESITFPFHAQASIFYNPEDIRKHKIHSRYCPAPLLSIVDQIRKDDKRYAVIGLPCHIHAIRKLQYHNSKWKEKIKFSIGLLCGGTPNMKGHTYIMRENKIDIPHIQQIDYRYGKWPKGAFVVLSDGRMVKFRQTGGGRNQNWLFKMMGVVYMSPYFWRRRCLFCADYFNSYADIACGDPWIKRYNKNIGGGTLTIVRSEKMQSIIKVLIKEGKVGTRMTVAPEEVEETMGNFQKKRIASFHGYNKYVKFFGMEFPDYKNFLIQNNNLATIVPFLNLLKAYVAKYEWLWPSFKYVQFIEDGLDFLKRKFMAK